MAAVGFGLRQGVRLVGMIAFKEEYPVLLTPLADPIEEQEARRQINEAALACYFGLPLWQTPMYRQDEGPVLIVAGRKDAGLGF